MDAVGYLPGAYVVLDGQRVPYKVLRSRPAGNGLYLHDIEPAAGGRVLTKFGEDLKPVAPMAFIPRVIEGGRHA